MSLVASYLTKLNKLNDITNSNHNKYIFRGQSDGNWQVISTYVRRLKNSPGTKNTKDTKSKETQFIEYHSTLIDSYKEYKYHEDKSLHDLEILQELQHFGAATGLIDFSKDFLVALWFACSGNYEENGKVFLFDISDIEIKTKDDLELKKIEDSIYYIDTKYKSNNRISSQNGVFILSIASIHDNTTFLDIAAVDKQNLLNELKSNFNISEETLFPDVFGFARVNDVNHPMTTKSASDYFEDGNKLYRIGEYDTAIADFTKAIELNPDDHEAYNNRGSVYAKLEKYDTAIADFTKAIELNPDDHEVYNNRGNAYADLKKYDTAIADYTTAIELKPDDHKAYYNRGFAYYSLKKYDTAIADFNKSIEIMPNNYHPYAFRDVAYRNLVEDYTTAIEIKPDDHESYYNRGSVYAKLEKYEQAIADIEHVFKLRPEFKTPEREQYLHSLKEQLRKSNE